MEQLVSFSGQWTDQERREITEAIELFEQTLNDPLPLGTYGRPWMCTSYPSEFFGRVYTASRYPSSFLITAYSTDELASRLIEYGRRGFRRAS
jgi:hypothetical protein